MTHVRAGARAKRIRQAAADARIAAAIIAKFAKESEEAK